LVISSSLFCNCRAISKRPLYSFLASVILLTLNPNSTAIDLRVSQIEEKLFAIKGRVAIASEPRTFTLSARTAFSYNPSKPAEPEWADLVRKYKEEA
jgi:hypothetical protein